MQNTYNYSMFLLILWDFWAGILKAESCCVLIMKADAAESKDGKIAILC